MPALTADEAVYEELLSHARDAARPQGERTLRMRVAVEAAHVKALQHPYHAAPWVVARMVEGTLMHDSTRHFQKTAERLGTRYPESLLLLWATAEDALQGRRAGIAVSLYGQLARSMPDHPLLPLCMAAASANVGAAKVAQRRHSDLARAFACLSSYADLRLGEGADGAATVGATTGRAGVSSASVPLATPVVAPSTLPARLRRAEVAYNTGRMAQLLSYSALASEQYELVLTELDALETEAGGRSALLDALDLRREAAYNLVHMYRAVGANEAARAVMAGYLRW